MKEISKMNRQELMAVVHQHHPLKYASMKWFNNTVEGLRVQVARMMGVLNIGDLVEFTDKSGEKLRGDVTALAFGDDKDVITVMCFKPSWSMDVSCLVGRSSVRLVTTA